MLSMLRSWTVEDYYRMTETGILHPGERVELIAGQVIAMSPKGTTHTAAVRRTARLLRNLLSNQASICTQDPIRLNDYSEPEPDIAVVKPDPLDYVDHHPLATEVYLIIEVADTSLTYDCNTKATLYAQSEIADYWVLDVNNRELHWFREPNQNHYQSQGILSQEQSIQPLQFPDVIIAVQEMLPTVTTS